MEEAEPDAAANDAQPASENAPTPELPDLQSVDWAVRHTGLSRRTVHRRLDAYHSEHPWISGAPYAIKGARRANSRRDRLVDPVDAERVRLQEKGVVADTVTALEWARRVREGDVPLLYVTNEEWFRRMLPPSSGS